MRRAPQDRKRASANPRSPRREGDGHQRDHNHERVRIYEVVEEDHHDDCPAQNCSAARVAAPTESGVAGALARGTTSDRREFLLISMGSSQQLRRPVPTQRVPRLWEPKLYHIAALYNDGVWLQCVKTIIVP